MIVVNCTGRGRYTAVRIAFSCAIKQVGIRINAATVSETDASFCDKRCTVLYVSKRDLLFSPSTILRNPL